MKEMTISERYHNELKDIQNRLEITLQFDLRNIMKKLTPNAKIDVKDSNKTYCNCSINYLYESIDTYRLYVLVGRNNEVVLFNVLPIETRFELFSYINYEFEKGKLKYI